MKNRLPVALAAACCILASLSFGRALASESNDGFVGRWKLVLNETTGDLEGLLELRREQGELIGRVEGGPIKVVTQGNRIEMVVDSRDAGARAFERTLTGALENGQLAGTYVSNEPGKAKAPPRTWRAVPYVEQNTAGQKPEPVDLSGVWFTTPLADLRKYSMSGTRSSVSSTKTNRSTSTCAVMIDACDPMLQNSSADRDSRSTWRTF